MAAFERFKSNEYKAVYITSFDNLDSTMRTKKVIRSKEFTCPDDPMEIKFQLEFIFGQRHEDWLSIYFGVAYQTEVFLREFTITVYDEDLHELERERDCHMDILDDRGLGYDKFYELSKIRESSLSLIRIKCEVVYNGDPVSAAYTTVKPRDPNLPENMIALLDSTEHADFTFLVKGEKIKAHKAILSARSNHFKCMLNSGMRECANNEVVVQDAEPLEFKEYLKFLYSGLPPRNLPEIAMSLLPLVDRYVAMELKEMCENAICGSLSTNNVIEILVLADLNDCQEMTKVCIPLFKENLKDLKKSSSWNLLRQKPALTLKLLESLG